MKSLVYSVVSRVVSGVKCTLFQTYSALKVTFDMVKVKLMNFKG